METLSLYLSVPLAGETIMEPRTFTNLDSSYRLAGQPLPIAFGDRRGQDCAKPGHDEGMGP